jgi:uncharacterized protein
VLIAVNHYWSENPATEAELDALSHVTEAKSEQPAPPRQRSGHWVH